MKLNFSVPVIALLGGAAIGFCLRSTPSVDAENGAASPTKEHSPSQIVDVGAEASVEALRVRIRELEALLAEEAKRGVELAGVERQNDDRPRREGPGRFNPREMMERLKTEDPERYAQITNQMARFRMHRTEQAISKLDFLSSLDLTAMGEAAQDTHMRLQSMIARREELEERIHSESISDDDRENAMHEMFSMEREIRDLNNQERENLIGETVRELGLSGEEAEDVVATLNEIIKVTSSDFGPPPGGPRGPRGGRGRR